MQLLLCLMVPSSACAHAAVVPKNCDGFGNTGHAQTIYQVRNETAHMRRERVDAVRRGLCRAGLSDLRRPAWTGTRPSGARPLVAKAGQSEEQGVDHPPAHAQSIVKNQPCLLYLLIGELEPEEGGRLPSGDARREASLRTRSSCCRVASSSSSYSFIDSGSITFMPTSPPINPSALSARSCVMCMEIPFFFLCRAPDFQLSVRPWSSHPTHSSDRRRPST